MEWEAAFIRRWILERARVGAWIWMGLGLLGLAAAEMLYDGWQLPLLLFWVWVIGYMDGVVPLRPAAEPGQYPLSGL